MSQSIRRRYLPLPLRPMVGVVALLLAFGLHAAAARTTSQEDVLAATLLTGWRTPQGSHMTALRLDLKPGWKTYWRSPGEAGIPPQFDWTASQNIKSFTLHWPTPAVFSTNGMQTIGYHDRLILPVEITPRDATRPMLLVARIDLGVCRDICMPATLELSAEIKGPGQTDRMIEAALKARPRSGKQAGLTKIACSVEPIKDGLRLTATLTLPAQGKAETVAVESYDPTIWVSDVKTTRQAGQLIAVTELVPPSGEPFALDRSGVTVTVISTNGAVELRGCPG